MQYAKNIELVGAKGRKYKRNILPLDLHFYYKIKYYFKSNDGDSRL